jgi:uncharacterized SAM-binding protein YcdF (DUF218 family)
MTPLPLEKAAPLGAPTLFGHLLRLVLAAALIWLGGFLHYAETLPEPAPPTADATDAIVVLTGGADRLDVGLKLLVEDKAKKLFISGVDRATTAEALQQRSGSAPDRFACCVVLGHAAEDTIGNAIETALWMQREKFTSLRLVTASYHMPRSLLLFRQTMPEAAIIPHPVFPAHVHLDDWWRWPGTARLLASEYNKYLASLVTVRLG